MKKWLPHLVYAGLMIAGALYFQWSVGRENRRIHFLNCPTDEAYLETARANRILKDHIRRTAEAYPNLSNTQTYSQARTADSLVAAALANPEERDSLAGRLWALAGHEPALEAFFSGIFSMEKTSVSISDYRQVLSQTDSLRLQTALLHTMQHFAERISGLDIRFDVYNPVVSYTTPCPRLGDPFQVDIVLGDSYTKLVDSDITVNDQNLQMNNGLAQFKHTFPDTGLYPLHVRARYRNWSSDSVSTTEKTFFLRVNR